MTAPLPDAVGVGDFSLMNDPYLPDVLIATADDLEPFMLGEAEMPSLNCALPAYLRDAATLIQSQAARIAELEEGLKPFAEAGAAIDVVGFGAALFPSDKRAFEASWSENGVYHELTWGDFRQARSLLSEGEGRGDYAASGSVPSRGSDAPAAPGEVGS